MISAEGIRMVFNEGTSLQNLAVDGVDLSVAEGEFVTVIGSNGSGKSTLLRIISGELLPTGGTVSVGGRDVTGMPQHSRAALVASVSQDPLGGTCAELSIAENMALAAMRGRRRGLSLAVSAPRRRDFAERLAALEMGLEDRLDDSVGLLSGGQRQALCLVMTTVSPSRILLLDEHTAALDPRMSDFVLRLTAGLYERFGLTVLMVTHSMRQALSHGNRTVMMHGGKVALDLDGSARGKETPASLFAEFERLHAVDSGEEGARAGGRGEGQEGAVS